MRKIGILIPLLVFVFGFPLAARSAPLRVVTYNFKIDEHGFGTSTGMGSTGIITYGGVNVTRGRSGTITLNVIQATRDGGLVVDALEHIDRADRPLQTIRCAVYENPATVVCDQNLVQAGEETEEVDTLLTYLGRGFYDTSRLDDKNHWKTVQSLSEGKSNVSTDFTVSAWQGDLLTIDVNRVYRTGSATTITKGTLKYDSGTTLPISGHFVTDSNEDGELRGSSVDFDLASDSWAKK